jgi:hypothetical protein
VRSTSGLRFQVITTTVKRSSGPLLVSCIALPPRGVTAV